MKLLDPPFRGWCECKCVPYEYETWATNKTINDLRTVTQTWATNKTINDLGTVTHDVTTTTGINTITTDTITINASDILHSSYTIDKNYNTKPIIENLNKESEDNNMPKKEKPLRMFYNVDVGFYKVIKYGTTTSASVIIMPEFDIVRCIYDKAEKIIGVEISFADGTKEKAICSPNDNFNLEHGITICLFKKIITYCNNIHPTNLFANHETGIYNKLVNHAIKVMERRIKAEEETKKKEAENKAKEQHFIEKKRRAKARRAKKESEQRISEMAEAIRRSGIGTNMNALMDDCK